MQNKKKDRFNFFGFGGKERKKGKGALQNTCSILILMVSTKRLIDQAYPFIPLKTASCYCAMQRKPFPVTLMVD